MSFKRTAAIALIGGALIAWLAGAATSNRPLPPLPPTTARAIDARGAALADEIARLHERLRPSAAPRQPARNLFSYRAARASAPPAPAPRPAVSEAAPPLPPQLPPLKLAGIGEDDGPDGRPVRIAFISGDGQLFMVKEGEMVTPRYRVTRISPDVVELQDVNDMTTRRLAMR
jgi:hypothetical protein